MTFTKRVLATMAIADLLLFGGWIAREERQRATAPIKLPVEGYDPRDYLSGHYVRFRLIAQREAEALRPPVDERRISFCLEATDDRYHVTRIRAADDRCTPFLTATRDRSGALDFGVDRFYLDERLADEVWRVQAGPETYLVAAVDEQGAVHPINLVVNGNALGARR